MFAFHELRKDKVWQGNICVMAKDYSSGEIDVAKYRFVQRSRLLVLCILPWISLL